MKPELLRALPKMDLLLARPALAGSPLPYALRRQAARQVLDEYRAAIEKVFGEGACYTLSVRQPGGTKVEF